MARKFMSFLGTNKYIPANYYFGDQKINNVTFVQEALVRIFCQDWDENDIICIFCTTEAEEKNWKGKSETPQANFEKGLYACLKDLNLKAQIAKISVPEGKSEAEILQIFKIVFDQLDDKDQIIFDITHSFRSLPMLNLVVLNYAKFLKNIRLEGIYYGAFETLGSYKEVKDMPLEKRNAPIFDLTPYDTLLEWSFAVSDFVTYGQTGRLKKLVRQVGRTLRQHTKTEELVNKLNRLSNNIICNRGNEIRKQDNFDGLIDQAKQENLIPAFEPLLQKIKQKTKDFKKDDIKNGFIAAKWCYEHGLIPQGITILQETLISVYCKKYGLDFQNKADRNLISSCLNVAHFKPKDRWNETLRKNQKAKQIINNLSEQESQLFRQITETRNDINHGGYNKNASKYNSFSQKLKNFLQKVDELTKNGLIH